MFENTILIMVAYSMHMFMTQKMKMITTNYITMMVYCIVIKHQRRHINIVI